MNRLALGLVAGALMGGCATLPAGQMDYGDRPMEAYLYPAAGSQSFLFEVNRPAHVAVFRISPGRGTSLVYPRPGFDGSSSTARAGTTWIAEFALRNSARDLQRSNVGFVSHASGPDFFFMIASEEPLDLDRIGSFGSNLPWALGSGYGAASPYSTMENLATILVPNWESANWATDYYVGMPAVEGGVLMAPPDFSDNWVLVSCGEGAGYVYVPIRTSLVTIEAYCEAAQEPEEEVEDELDTEAAITDHITSAQLSRPESWEQRRREAVGAQADRAFDDLGGDNPRSQGSDLLNRANSQRRDRTRPQTQRAAGIGQESGRSSGAGSASAASSGRASEPPASRPRSNPTPASDRATSGLGGDS